MFNLEQSIAEWRQQMLAAGIQMPAPLNELESHLREDAERHMKSGMDEQEAFRLAVQTIAQAGMLKNEFQKNGGKNMKRKLMMSAGVIALLLGIMMILPALGKHHERNAAAMSTGANFAANPWAKDEVYGLRMGVAMTVIGVAGAVYASKARKPQQSHV